MGTQREALEDVLKSVSPDSLEQAARTLASARLIDLYSVENSCAPASDLLTKLTYLGLRAASAPTRISSRSARPIWGRGMWRWPFPARAGLWTP